MRFRIVLSTLLALVVSVAAIADELKSNIVNTKQNKWSSSRYFVKGVEAYDDVEIDVAIEMFEKELKLHPSNGYAQCNLALSRYMQAMYEMKSVLYDDESSEQDMMIVRETGERAMGAAIPALDEGIAMLSSADAEGQCQAYRLKAYMLSNFEVVDSAQVSACYDKAIAAHPCEEVYVDHMSFFSENIEVVITDAQTLRSLYPDDPSNVKLLAVMTFRGEDYSQSLAYCEEYSAMLKSQGEESLDTQVAPMQLVSLKELGREEEAMDLALKYIEDYDLGEAVQIFMMLAKKNPDLAEIKIKQRVFADTGDPMLWNVMLGRIMEFKRDYGSALEYFKTLEKTNHEAFVLNEMANCYYMLGDTDNALLYIDAATIMNDGGEYAPARDKMLINTGMASKVINEVMTGVEFINKPSDNEISRRLTLIELLLQERDYAQVEKVFLTIADSVYSAKALTIYAEALKGLGRDDEAQSCLQKIFDLDAVPLSDFIYLIQAHNALGQVEEARKKTESLSLGWEGYQQNPDDDGYSSSCYDIAVVYALLGDSDKALEYLEKHFIHDEMPYNFGFMERDRRLDSVRELPQYKALVEKYKKQWKSNAK